MSDVARLEKGVRIMTQFLFGAATVLFAANAGLNYANGNTYSAVLWGLAAACFLGAPIVRGRRMW